MPSVPYLSGGESLSAAGMNTLFAEADRRVSLALDDHSFLYLQQTTATRARTLFAPYLGPVFKWCSGSQRIAGYWGLGTGNTQIYDHSIFTNAVASATTYSGSLTPVYDSTAKWVRIAPLATTYFTQLGLTRGTAASTGSRQTASPSLLVHSLEAHRRLYTPPDGVEESYWIQETLSNVAQQVERIRSYEQAELIFEGGPTELDFLGTWNKYRFFRIHNLNTTTLTVRFRNTDGDVAHTVTVPAHGSRCVRRTGVDGTYTDGYQHFQKFLPGDPRFYQATNVNGFGHNVINPSIIIPFVNRVLAGQSYGTPAVTFAAPTVVLDPHVRAPLPSGGEGREYSAIYGDATEDETLLGDVLHHQGAIQVRPVNGDPVTSVNFTGYADLLAGIPGIETQLVGNTLQIKSSVAGVNLVALSTNLLTTGGSGFMVTPVRDGDNWSNIDAHMPTGAFYKDLAVRNAATHAFTYREFAANGTLAGTVNVTGTPTLKSPSALVSFSGLVPWRDTVADVKAVLDDPALCTFTAGELVLTGGGITLYTTQTIPLDYPLAPLLTAPGAVVETAENRIFEAWAQPVIQSLGISESTSASYPAGVVVRTMVTAAEGSLTIKRAVVFKDYGFPDLSTWFYSGFLTPRLTRVYGTRAATTTPHPDFREGWQNADGEEVKYIGDSVFVQTDIAICSPWNLASFQPATTEVGRSMVVGVLRDFDEYGIYPAVGESGTWPFVRLPMAVEHYNNMAATVNSIVRVKPLNFLDHFMLQLGMQQTTRELLFRHNRRGIYEWANSASTYGNLAGLRPVDQYASFASEGDTYSAQIQSHCTALGIPIYTQASFPGWELLTTKRRRTSNAGAQTYFDAPVTATQVDDADGKRVEYRVDGTINIDTSALVHTDLATLCRPDLAAVSNYRWVKVSDLQNYATSLGYEFCFAQFGPRFDLAAVTVGDVETLNTGDQVFRHNAFTNVVVPSFWVRHATVPASYPTAATSVRFQSTFTFESRFVEFLPNPTGTWITGSKSFDVGGPRVESTPIHLQPVGVDRLTLFSVIRVRLQWANLPTDNTPMTFSRINGTLYLNDGICDTNYALTGTPSRDEFLRVCWPKPLIPYFTMRNPTDYSASFFPGDSFLVTDETPTPAVVVSAGMTNNSLILSSPVPSFEFPDNFSDIGTTEALAAAINGPVVYPCTVVADGGERLQLWADFSVPVA